MRTHRRTRARTYTHTHTRTYTHERTNAPADVRPRPSGLGLLLPRVLFPGSCTHSLLGAITSPVAVGGIQCSCPLRSLVFISRRPNGPHAQSVIPLVPGRICSPLSPFAHLQSLTLCLCSLPAVSHSLPYLPYPVSRFLSLMLLLRVPHFRSSLYSLSTSLHLFLTFRHDHGHTCLFVLQV